MTPHLTKHRGGSRHGTPEATPVRSPGTSALAGSTLKIHRSGDKEIVIDEWDGQSFELKL